MNCRYLSWTLSQFNSRNSLTQILDILPLTCIYFALIEVLILVSLKYFESKLCRHNQKDVVSVYYIKAYVKGVLKNDFVYVETLDVNLFYQLRSMPLFHQRYFNLKYILDILLLHIV